MRGVTPGEHVLMLEAWGFSPRVFHISVGRELHGTVRVGAIVLEALPPVLITVNGRITDANSGLPVGGAPLGLNGKPAGFTDVDGRFQLRTYRAVGGSLNHLTMRRIGYAALDYDFWFPDTVSTVDLALTAEPLAEQLPDIEVYGELMVLGGERRLAGFERRRKAGLGRFMTEKDIRKVNATQTTDILRRIPGVVVRRTTTGSVVALQGSGGMCPAPVIFVDGTRVGTADVDFVLLPDALVGIEVYRSGVTMPLEFDVQGSGGSANCGVLAFWTK
jgi:hypothetical protein